MRTSILWALALVGAASVALASPVEEIRVDFDLSKESGYREVTVKITNLSSRELELRHPGQHQVLGFIVMSRTGERHVPEGIAKVDPRHQRLKLSPKETFEYKVAHGEAGIAPRRPHYFFPYLTGTGLFGYRLKPGGEYRVIAVYRPLGTEHDGVCSREKLVEIPKEANKANEKDDTR